MRDFLATNHRPRATDVAKSAGFTLVELLIVIGIIAVLISLLLPAVSKVRVAAQRVATQGTMNRIAAACEAYYGTQNAYPGVFQNRILSVGNGTTIDSPETVPSIAIAPATTVNPVQITSTENMMLSILGGLQIRNNVLTYDATLVGNGASNLNTSKPGKLQAFLEVRQNELTTNYANPAYTAGLPGQWSANDTIVPEVLDGFASPRPILYIRANKGNTQIYGDSSTTVANVQYDIRQLYAYGFPDNSNTAYLAAYPADVAAGLQPGHSSYFGNHELSRPTPTPGIYVAQHKDAYLLISAGPDGKFGTADDLRN